jgi:hypothetical protein
MTDFDPSMIADVRDLLAECGVEVPDDETVRRAIEEELRGGVAREERTPMLFARGDAGGRWITIGGNKGEDGKRHGGSPVYVVNGRITKGHPGLTGKRIDAIGADSDPEPSHRQLLNRSRGYARAVWGKKARREGIAPQHLHQFAAEIMAHDREFKADKSRMLREAREQSNRSGFGDLRTLAARNAAGKLDANAVKGLDVVGESMAANYPQYFKSGEEAGDQLYDMLVQGAPEPVTEDEAYDEAFGHLVEQKQRDDERQPGDEPEKKRARKLDEIEEPVPFSRGDVATAEAAAELTVYEEVQAWLRRHKKN